MWTRPINWIEQRNQLGKDYPLYHWTGKSRWISKEILQSELTQGNYGFIEREVRKDIGRIGASNLVFNFLKETSLKLSPRFSKPQGLFHE